MKNVFVLAACAVVGLLTAEAFAQDCGCGVGSKAVSSVRTTAHNVVGTAVGVTRGAVSKAKGALCHVKSSVGSRLSNDCCAQQSACVTQSCTTVQTVTVTTVAAACNSACDCSEGLVAKAGKRVKARLACAKERRCARKASKNSCCTTSSAVSCVIESAPQSEPTAALPPSPTAAEVNLLESSK